jgi:hypothetical protein
MDEKERRKERIFQRLLVFEDNFANLPQEEQEKIVLEHLEEDGDWVNSDHKRPSGPFIRSVDYFK